ncbi:MAG: hypothetical protein AAGD28_04210 [Bacteroidota bacterium]
MRIELSHDLIGKQVYARLSADEKAIRKAARMLKDSYELHTSLSEEGKSRLLNREELIFLSSYIKDIQPGPKMVAYLGESEEAVQEAEEAEKKRLKDEIALREKQRQTARRFNVLLGVLVVSMVAFFYIQFETEINKVKDDLFKSEKRQLDARADSLKNKEIEIQEKSDSLLANKDIKVNEVVEKILSKEPGEKFSSRNIAHAVKLENLKNEIENRLISFNDSTNANFIAGPSIRNSFDLISQGQKLSLTTHIFENGVPPLTQKQSLYFQEIAAAVNKDSSKYNIDLGVHTDSRGAYSQNSRTSLGRASLIADVLLKSLDDNSELSIYCKGESEPLRGRPLADNRRTVLIFSVRE